MKARSLHVGFVALSLLCRPALAQDDEGEDGPRTIGSVDVSAFDWRREDTEWRSPTVIERDHMRALAHDLVQGPEGCSERGLRRTRRRVEELHFRMDVVDVRGQSVILVREGDDAFGAGLLAVRCGPAEPIVWQAPHPFFDLGTGDLVLQWFVEGDARAAQWSTSHRFRATEDELRADDVHPADVADEPGSLFQAATVGLLSGNPDLRFVQVHGYAKRSAPRYEAVVSSGDSRYPLREVSARLDGLLGPVAAFGIVDLPLGGQQNAQGRVLPIGTFLHLELSPKSRDRLSEDETLRRRMARAIGDGPW